MRYLILSDLHGNWDALAAVQRDPRQLDCEATLVLGDLVGYGADPDRVVSAVRRLPEPAYTVRGNHDRVVTDLSLAAGFNEAAQRAAPDGDPLGVSFKHALEELLTAWPMLVTSDLSEVRYRILPRLLTAIASHQVTWRPGRSFPRKKDNARIRSKNKKTKRKRNSRKNVTQT